MLINARINKYQHPHYECIAKCWHQLMSILCDTFKHFLYREIWTDCGLYMLQTKCVLNLNCIVCTEHDVYVGYRVCTIHDLSNVCTKHDQSNTSVAVSDTSEQHDDMSDMVGYGKVRTYNCHFASKVSIEVALVQTQTDRKGTTDHQLSLTQTESEAETYRNKRVLFFKHSMKNIKRSANMHEDDDTESEQVSNGSTRSAWIEPALRVWQRSLSWMFVHKYVTHDSVTTGITLHTTWLSDIFKNVYTLDR